MNRDMMLSQEEGAAPPFALQSIGRYVHMQKLNPTGRFIPPEHELIELVTEGTCWVEHDGDWIDAPPGTIIWHVEGDKTIGRTLPEDPYHCMTIFFRSPGLRGRRVPRISMWPALDEVRTFNRDMLRAFAYGLMDRETLKICAFGRLLYQARLYHSQRVSSRVPPNLVAVLEIIEERYSETLEVTDLASIAGWSVPHLHAMCKQYFEMSPHQLLMRRRMQAAREYMAATDQPVKQVSSACGYTNEAAFCRQFKREVGSTPSEYRLLHTLPVTSKGKPRHLPDFTPRTEPAE